MSGTQYDFSAAISRVEVDAGLALLNVAWTVGGVLLLVVQMVQAGLKLLETAALFVRVCNFCVLQLSVLAASNANVRCSHEPDRSRPVLATFESHEVTGYGCVSRIAYATLTPFVHSSMLPLRHHECSCGPSLSWARDRWTPPARLLVFCSMQ